jgi:hypothetical protein
MTGMIKWGLSGDEDFLIRRVGKQLAQLISVEHGEAKTLDLLNRQGNSESRTVI